MELHELYQRCRADLVVLELSQARTGDLRSLIGQLVGTRNEELSKDSCTLENLEAFRKLLCREYQLSFQPDQTPVGEPRLNPGCLKGIESLLLAGRRLSAPIGTIRDILVLRTVLYCDPGCIGQHVVDMGDPSTFANDKEERDFRVRMIEGILDAIRLRRILYEDEQSREDIARTFLTNAMPWLKIEQGTDWQSFASIFRKLHNVFGPEDILLPLVWDMVLDKRNELADTLNALCVTADIFLPSDRDKLTGTHYALCCTANLCSLIEDGLRSPVQQCRKRALFVMRRAIELIENMDGDRVADQTGLLVPFYSGPVTEDSSTGFRDKYFLLMEALEEKQYRLISPVLTHLPVLLKDCQEHWTSDPRICILLEKILGHGNVKVRMEGISRLCEFGPTAILDDRLLEVFLRGLNETLLYKTEGQTYGEPPGLVEKLAGLFARTMERDRGFGKRLLDTMNRLEPGWARVPLFYLVVVLRRAVCEIRDCPFRMEELTLIRSLARKYSSTYPASLKGTFETELIRTITNTSGPIKELEALMEVLSELSVLSDGTWIESRCNLLTVWLKKVVRTLDAVEYVRYTCESYNHRRDIREGGIQRFALAIVLLHDAGIITLDQSCPSRETLNEWFSSLNGIEQRPYADLEATLDIMYMITCLAQQTRESISGLCRPYIGTIMNFLFKGMRNVAPRLNKENLPRYGDVLQTFLWNKARLIPEKQAIDYVEDFRIESRSLLNHITEYTLMHCAGALYVLYLAQEKLQNEGCYGKILRLVPKIKKLDDDGSHGLTSGALASECYFYVALLLCQSVSRNGLAKTEPEQLDQLLASLSELLDIGGREMPTQIARVLSAIAYENVVNEETRSAFENVLATCWKSVFLDRHSPEFLEGAKALAEVIAVYQGATTSSELVDQLLNDCEDAPFVKLHMLEKIVEKELYSASWPNHQNLLLSCLLYGHAPTKDKRIERELHVYISKNDFCPVEPDSNDERLIRAGGMNALYQLKTWSVGFVEPFVRLLVDNLNKYAGKRYHSQSDVHRTKHRLMQAILILESRLNEESAGFLAENLIRLIVLDSDQPSVRLMQEWTLVRIFRRRKLRKILWQFFEQAMKERPRCTISAARIVYHLAPSLNTVDRQTAFGYVSLCCFGSQFDMRLYNQVALERLYQCLEKGSDVTCYKFLYTTIAKSLEKTRSKIADDFFLYKLRPDKDCSFKIITYEFPRLSGMDQYEWIDPGLLNTILKICRHPFLLSNTDSLLTETVSSIHQTTKSDEMEAEETEVGLADVQKKIDPTSYVVDPSASAAEKPGITVVASLIDRPANLGGLARTCEIFRAKELVIGNSGRVRDTEFQNLSVSADKWIQITEVKPSELQDYLLAKKEAGWTLVGAEQTANSVPLQDATFTEKTVLVLGNEKTGIPANLIPLLDTCVEIPQLGVTRSLNVHVTGAICVWEYTKQHSL